MMSVTKITKEKTARIIPNAVGIATAEDKHVFGSLMSRDNTYRLMTKVWDAAMNSYAPHVEPEILVSPISASIYLKPLFHNLSYIYQSIFEPTCQ